MAEWTISRPISGFTPTTVNADDISVASTHISLYNKGEIVCTVFQMPGLVVTRNDAVKS
jgi:hypothetical protein